MSLLERISQGMGTPSIYVEKLARTANTHYRVATIPKKNGGTRTIWMPSQELKAAQRWLTRVVIRDIKIHPAATAYESGATIRENARRHATSKYLLRMDFRRFFESITKADVRAFMATAFQPSAAWSPEDIELFADLVCWGDGLVIGAVTSPSLTNRMCFEMDSQIANVCEPRHVVYSRYADDLFFSTTTPCILRVVEHAVQEIVRSLAVPKSLRINSKKTRHLSKRQRRTVTGLLLTSEGAVSLGRERKRKVRALIHQLDRLSTDERGWLRGTIAFCRDAEPAFVNQLVLKYGAAQLRQVQAPPR